MPGRMGCSISPRRALVRVCSPVSTRTVYSHIANAAQSAQPRAPLASRNAVTGLPVALARGPFEFYVRCWSLWATRRTMQEPPALEVQVVEALTKQATPNKLTLPTSAADDSPATTPCEAMEGGGLTPTGGDGSASDAQSLLGYQARSTRALRSDRKADPEVVLEHRFTRWVRPVRRLPDEGALRAPIGPAASGRAQGRRSKLRC